jgi:hypothetical protein
MSSVILFTLCEKIMVVFYLRLDSLVEMSWIQPSNLGKKAGQLIGKPIDRAPKQGMMGASNFHLLGVGANVVHRTEVNSFLAKSVKTQDLIIGHVLITKFSICIFSYAGSYEREREREPDSFCHIKQDVTLALLSIITYLS